VLPWCESLLEFYDQHFPKYSNGTLFLQHAQSCETWPDCDNPAAQVAALIRIAEGLNAIPKSLLSTEQAAFFSRIAKSLPAIPLTTDPEDGLLQVRKNVFFSRCVVLKNDHFMPRQARDKHRKSSNKDVAPAGRSVRERVPRAPRQL